MTAPVGVLTSLKTLRTFSKFRCFSQYRKSEWFALNDICKRTPIHGKNNSFTKQASILHAKEYSTIRCNATNIPRLRLLSLDYNTCSKKVYENHLSGYNNGRRDHHSSCRRYSTNDVEDGNRKPSKVPLRLSSWRPIIWPSVIKTIKNWFFAVLIKGYMDDTFSSPSFLNAAEQAVYHVSKLLSEGQMDDLKELVDDKALVEAQHYLSLLSIAQRQGVAVNKEDMFLSYIHEIGMIFDDETDQRFVEITTVFQGLPGYHDLKEKGDAENFQDYLKEKSDELYICNYRFIREFTKGVEGDWKISRLNHFHPQEVAESTSPFRR